MPNLEGRTDQAKLSDPEGRRGGAADDPKVMSLVDHIDELRSRLVKACGAVLIIFMIAMGVAEKIIGFLKGPLLEVLPPKYANLHFTGPLDVIVADMKVAFLISIVLGCPVWLYQFWRFIEPALYKHERKYILPFIIASVGLFFSGVVFCYYVMLPLSLKFLIGMGLEVGIPIITVGDYISLLILLIISFGFIFETPMILIILALMNLITHEGMAKSRRYVIVGILIVAAILTPPDPISQLAMAIPMYIMYEISIVIIRMLKKKRTE